MSTVYLSTTRTIRFGLANRIQVASEFSTPTTFSGLGLLVSFLFVVSGGEIVL